MAEGIRQSGRRRNGGSVLRVSPYLDPVALIGITLSIVGSVLVDLTNREALDRGVRIKRIFVYTMMTTELDELAAQQEDAGVQVGLVHATALDPTLWHNLAIWGRLSQIFQACLRAARPRNQAPATPR